MKKTALFLAFILMLATCCSLCACGGNSQPTTTTTTTTGGEISDGGEDDVEGGASEGLEFISKGNGTCSVSGLGSCEDKSIVIPSSSPSGEAVTSVDAYAFYNCTEIESVVIPNGVQSIGNYAFASCVALEAVDVPDTLTSIEAYAFYGCSGIKDIEIPNGIKSVHTLTFCDCDALEYNVYDNARYLGNKENPYVVLIEPDSKSIMSCNIHTDTRLIASSAFSHCSALESIDIPDAVVSVGYIAFEECSSLKSITVGIGVTNIGAYAFSFCSSLESITVREGNAVYHSAGDCLIKTESNTVVLGCKSSVIPADGSVTAIGAAAFSECKGLRSIDIPESITLIGYRAFWSCTDLKALNYNGKKIQWNAISKRGEWDYNTGAYTINCTDGIISK